MPSGYNQSWEKKYRIHIATNYRASHIDSTILPLNSNTVLINSVRVLKNKVPKVFNKWRKIFFSNVTEVPESELNFQKKVRDKAYKNLKEIGVNSYFKPYKFTLGRTKCFINKSKYSSR